jgi:hypothetical protein
MKRQRNLEARAGPPPTEQTDSEDEQPEAAPLQGKRPRKMPLQQQQGSSSSEELDSGDSQRDSEEESDEVRAWGEPPAACRPLPACPPLACSAVATEQLPLLPSPSLQEEMGGGDEGDEEGGLPMGQLVALRQDGSTSAEAMKARARALRHAVGAGSFKREGKHRPMEMTSKKPVPREALQGGKRCAPGCGGCVAQRRAAEMGLRRLVVLAASCLLLAYKTCSLPETCNPTPAACLQGCAGPSL